MKQGRDQIFTQTSGTPTKVLTVTALVNGDDGDGDSDSNSNS